MRKLSFYLVVFGLLLGIPFSSLAGDKDVKIELPEQYWGNIVCMQSRVSSMRMVLNVEQYSTDDEVFKLLRLLKEKGQDAVIDKMWDMKPKGWIKIGNSLGYPVVVFRNIPTKEGRIIRAYTDRPIQMAENMRSLRSRDYPFGIIELRIKPDGTGEGTFLAATKATFDDKLELEPLGSQACKILHVKRRKK